MSYILDALKKSEQERNQGSTPDIHSVHSNQLGTSAPRRKTRNLVLLLLALTLVLIGALVFGNFLLTTEKKVANHEQGNNALNVQSIGEDGEESGMDTPVLHPREELKISMEENGDEITAEFEQAPLPEIRTTITGLPRFRDLPEEFRERLPALSFAGHTYSEDQSQRMIIVNNSILREGERIDKDLRLVEITWEGLILEFEGQRFLLVTEQDKGH